MPTSTTVPPAPNGAPLPNANRLFVEFARMALSGFGGVLPWARRSIVERNRWMSDRDFAEMLAICQVLPGPNICNLAVMFGWRCARVRGACAAFAGLVLVPMLLLLAIAALYAPYSNVPVVRNAVMGMLAVTAGLILATGLKLAKSVPRSWRALFFGMAAFCAVGLLHWPLLWVVLILGPASLALEWLSQRRRGRGTEQRGERR